MPSRCSQSIFSSQCHRRSSSFHSNLGLSPFLHPRPAPLSLVSSFFSDPLTSLIYPQMFFPFPPLSDSTLLNFCHSSAPIRFDTFQLKPHGRRCLGTHCVSRRAAVTGSGANKTHC
ncbi:hypothetical protein TNCV_3483511 [Trichonephila clavipes]|nr:hypothetical protein TNCV_3483511 [Trichonephila clavipes]